ncbi:MAG: DEAD/DEAH box helicase [Prolixibacteraceae bacterium]|nr:DEAD/DEAH box helicase [Prolixibacteraceae bacterium]
MKENNNPDKFIIALTEHRALGYVLQPCIINKKEHGAFYSIESYVIKQDVEETPEIYTGAQKELVKIIEKYSDENLAKRFSREKSITTFFNETDNKLFSEHVFPYIDKQIIACIDLIRKQNIDLYYKPVKYSNIYDDDKIEIEQKPAEAVFHFTTEGEGFKYQLEIKQNGKPVKILNRKPVVLANSPCRMVLHNRMYWFETLTAKRLSPFLKKEFISVPASIKEKYLKTFVHGILSGNDVTGNAFEIENVESEKKVIISIEKDLNLEPILVLIFQYGEKHFKAGRTEGVKVELVQENGNFKFYKHFRDFKWERSVIAFLSDYGFDIVGDVLRYSIDISNDFTPGNYSIISWINQHKSELEKRGIEIRQNLPQNYYIGELSVQIESKLNKDWFDVYAVVQIGEYEIPFIRFKKNIMQRRREFVLPNGDIAILPAEWFNEYSNLLLFARGDNERLKLAKHHYRALSAQALKNLKTEIGAVFEKISNKSFSVCPIPGSLNAILRDYQLDGYSWMRYLSDLELGGCLADDMGLGKTIQTLSLLLYEKESSKKIIPAFDETGMASLFDQVENKATASLIVLPTSLVHNWQNEIQKFAPSLKVYLHVGAQRRREGDFQSLINYYDVFLTTYGTIRNDYELFKDVVFNYIILDESQNIKNSDSKTYHAVCAIQSEKKLVLTGTPIENSLSDLWSQFNFLNKGILGSHKVFRDEFIVPIEKNADEDKQNLLFKIIDPFILRRTKEQVAKDLPPKTELVQYCEMTEIQTEIYEKEKNSIRNTILNNIKARGIAKSTIVILQGLTRLRQLANHPKLQAHENTTSGKFDLVFEHLEDLYAENHKVLMFSSFVTHLELFRHEFEKRAWGYSILTGQTRDREKAINEFQNDKEKRFFLISLKAGGVGLNLTAADYIMILDPWWNPAAENQAISRAHRIGQNKKVFVYRYITEASIEEKILKLQERKAALADMFIRTKSPFDGVDAKDVMDLFE